MPVTKYKLDSLYINSVQIDPNDISSFQITLEQDPNNATLPISVCEIGIKNNISYTFTEHNKIVITFSSTVSGTSNIVYNFYISKIDRSNEKELSISAVDYIGLLDESYFEKAYKTATPALTIIADILTDINGTVLSRISSDVNLTPVFENMTKRQALQHVLFATGYRIRTNANQGNYDLEIYPESYESTAITVDDSVVYRGSSLVKNNEVNGVSITSHDYKLDDFGTVVVGEERFKDKNKVRNLRRTSDVENVINVSGAVCIQETNLNDVALRIYNDYQRYQDLNFDYVWCGEHIGKKLTIEAEDGMHTGFLKKLFLDVGLLSVVASGSMVLPNNNIVSPTETSTQTVTSTGSISNEVTYEELCDLIKNNKLVAGAYYTLTDYMATVEVGYTYGDNHETVKVDSFHGFDIIIKAISSWELSEAVEVKAKENDTYYQYVDLNKWEVRYCLYNLWKYHSISKQECRGSTIGMIKFVRARKNCWEWETSNNDKCYTNAFPVIGDNIYSDIALSVQVDTFSDVEFGKGCIYYMKDDRQNEAGYDFKNIKFLRYGCASLGSIFPGSGLNLPSSNLPNKPYLIAYEYDYYRGRLHPSGIVSDGVPNYYYTFDNGLGEDNSVLDTENSQNYCRSNVIKGVGLSNIVFIGRAGNVIVERDCRAITICGSRNIHIYDETYWGLIYGCSNISIGADSYDFILESCNHCEFGNYSHDVLLFNSNNIRGRGGIAAYNCETITLDNAYGIEMSYCNEIYFGPGCNNIYFRTGYCRRMHFEAGVKGLYVDYSAYAPSSSDYIESVTFAAGGGSSSFVTALAIPPYISTPRIYGYRNLAQGGEFYQIAGN